MKSGDATDLSDSSRLVLVVEHSLISHFFPLLQQGVTLNARIGCSVKTFLVEEMQLGSDTIEQIQSIFLDGRPVDDLESAMITNCSVLALSAAMPGLVGATLRRGGRYAAFRSSITYHETGTACVPQEGNVQIKIYNLLMREMGPGLLARGIFVKSSDLMALLQGEADDFWKGCKNIFLDDVHVKGCDLLNNTELLRHPSILVSVSSG